MKKIVIFNVGDGFCALLLVDQTKKEINETKTFKILIDCGSSEDFNPPDFLVKLAEKQKWEKNKSEDANGRYEIDQLIVSHPHKDHISAIESLDESFCCEYITCPNDNKKVKEGKGPINPRDAINWDLFDGNDSSIKRLKKMLEERELPLIEVLKEKNCCGEFLFWLHPKDVEKNPELRAESYQNNISLVALFIINNNYILFPGDIQKEGMKALLKQSSKLTKKLKEKGLDFLIAPHHGLKSSFSEDLFDAMDDHKTRRLNIVSEKVSHKDDNRVVDSRYSDADHCEGNNNLESTNGTDNNFQRKTSNGHICIDFSSSDCPDIEIIQDEDELLNWLLEE